MLRPHAMHPKAWKAFINACAQAKINPEFGTRPNGKKGARIMQIIGTAPASAGYHGSDGSYNVGTKNYNYCAAIDIRSTDLSKEQCETFWKALLDNNFAAWWRHDGSFANNQHFHVVYLGIPMKKQLRSQAHSFFDRKSGLVTNKTISFLNKTNLSDDKLQQGRTLFLSNNRMNGMPLSVFETIYHLDLPIECGCDLTEDNEGVYGDIEDDSEPQG